MTITVYSVEFLDGLVTQARSAARLRQHRNLHSNYDEPCQRLFNAIEPSSYIRPHKHDSASLGETFVVVRGLLALFVFDDLGSITAVHCFGAERYSALPGVVAGATVHADTWHTVVALTSGAVLLEVKAGPFVPTTAKHLAPWAPPEGDPAAASYLQSLVDVGRMHLSRLSARPMDDVQFGLSMLP